MHGQIETRPSRRISPGTGIRFTPEAINELDWFLSRSGQMLADALLTFQRMEAGLRLVYGLDFEILYAYANPWSREATQSRIVQYLVEQDSTPFVLLPGTIEELTTFITQANKKKLEAERVVEAINMRGATEATVKAAVELCQSVGLPESSYGLSKGTSSSNVQEDILAYGVLQAVDRYVVALKRIDQVLKSERFVPLQSLFVNPVDNWFKEEHVQAFALRMYGHREDRHNNLPDAKNLAVIAQHGNHEARRFAENRDMYRGTGVMLRLLTNTRCLFQIDLHPEYSDFFLNEYVVLPDRTALNEIGHSFALRNCTEAALATAIQQQVGENNPSAWRELAFKYMHAVRKLRSQLAIIDNHARNFVFRGVRDTERLRQAIEELPKYVSDEASEFLSEPWYTAMKKLFLHHEAELANKAQVASSSAVTEQLDVERGSVSLDMAETRTTSLQKIEVPSLADDSPRSFLDLYKVTVGDASANLGGEELQTFVIKIDSDGVPSLPKLPEGLYTIRINRFQDTWYTEWCTSLSVPEVLSLINSIFRDRDGMLYGNEYQGALFLTTCDALEDEEPVITDICRLPLESQFLMAGYMELLPLVSEVEYERDVTQIEPVDIRCDTTVCHLRFDIAPAAGEPGILFAFRDARLLPILIEIFRKTSPFGSCDSCLQKIKEVVQEN